MKKDESEFSALPRVVVVMRVDKRRKSLHNNVDGVFGRYAPVQDYALVLEASCPVFAEDARSFSAATAPFACASFSENFPFLASERHLRRVSHPPNLNTLFHHLRDQACHPVLTL